MTSTRMRLTPGAPDLASGATAPVVTSLHRFQVGVDGHPFCETDDRDVVERAVGALFRSTPEADVWVADRERGETVHIERRITERRRVERRAS